MKKLFILNFIIIIISIKFSFSQNQNDSYFEANGRTMNEEKQFLNGVSIKVFKNNEFVKEMITKNEGKFKMAFEFNNKYKIMFSKEGFFAKTSVLFDTTIPKDKSSVIYSYEFKVTLYKNNADSIQTDSSNIRTMIIQFNPQIDDFGYKMQ